MSAAAGAAEDPAALRAALMVVRVRGRADEAAVAEAAGLSIDGVRRLLHAAADRKDVRRLDDACRWALTDAGRATLAALNAGAGIDGGRLAADYEQFLLHDAELKRAITAWQEERSTVRLHDVRTSARAAAPLLQRLATVDPRYAHYAARWSRLVTRIDGGDASAVARPGADSLHQAWFELHEDLLVMLDRTRSS